MSKTWKGTGALWLKDGIKAASNAPRWTGSFTCTCGRKNEVDGFGRDQINSSNPKAPTIKLMVKGRE